MDGDSGGRLNSGVCLQQLLWQNNDDSTGGQDSVKKRLIDIETNIVWRLLKCHGQLRVLIVVSEKGWRLPRESKHNIFYCVSDINDTSSGDLIQAKITELPIMPESIDFLVLPHVMRKQDSLAALMHDLDTVIKPNGRILFFGANDSELYCADDIRQALKARDFQILRHRGYHMLPFLGETLGQVFDRFFGQYFPWIGTAYWILAKKRVVAIKPLRVTKWKKLKKPLNAGKIRPIVGRANKDAVK